MFRGDILLSMPIDRHRHQLTTNLADALENLPPAQAAIGSSLLSRFALGDRSSDEWAERFSDLTLLYPALHEDLTAAGHREYARPPDIDGVNLAHAWMIIHTFVEDRLRDGQMADPGAGTSFASVCLSEGLLQLQAAGCLSDATRDAVRATMRRYYEAVDMPYLGDASTGPFDLTDERVIEIASGRAAFGWVATEAMLIAAEVPFETLADLARAFDLTVTGMQWVDDIADWHEDITTGDDNLLLVGLAHGFGLNAYELPANELRSPNIAHALLANNLFGWAEDNAVHCFTRARDIAAAHGLTDLTDLLQKRIDAATQVREREQLICTELVDTALKLFQQPEQT